jgi:hypothetical protein
MGASRLARWVVALLLLILLTGCKQTPSEEQIRSILQDMSAAVAEGNPRAFLEPLAEDFAGEIWQLDRRGARLLLLREMRAHERLRARLVDVQVELASEDRARATFQAVLTGGSGLLPQDGGWYRVQTGWRKTNGDWEMINAAWERVIGR